mgnify:CR=1 FL=1
MSDFASLNQHQKKALVIQLYEQGKTRRQIAEVAHMSFNDIADVIQKTLAKTIFRNPQKWSREWDSNPTHTFVGFIRVTCIGIEL